MAFERNLEDNLFQLREELIAGFTAMGIIKHFGLMIQKSGKSINLLLEIGSCIRPS